MLRPLSTDKCQLKNQNTYSWFEVSSSQAKYSNDGHSYGFKNRGISGFLGLVATINPSLFIGSSLSAQEDYYTYDFEGTSRQFGLTGSLFGLFRPSFGYCFFDILSTFSSGKMSRISTIGTLQYSNQSNPQGYASSVYLEAGKDFLYKKVNLQPFTAIQVQYCWWMPFSEHQKNIASLRAPVRQYTYANSKLGFHFTTLDNNSNVSLGADASWNLRLTPFNTHRSVQFESFGTPFLVESCNLSPSSFEMNLWVNHEICKNLNAYAAFDADFWKKAQALSIKLGFVYHW